MYWTVNIHGSRGKSHCLNLDARWGWEVSMISLKFMRRSSNCKHTLGDRKFTTHILSQHSNLSYHGNTLATELQSVGVNKSEGINTKLTANKTQNQQCTKKNVSRHILCHTWSVLSRSGLLHLIYFRDGFENTYPCRRSTQSTKRYI